jgi:hypothetical protein
MVSITDICYPSLVSTQEIRLDRRPGGRLAPSRNTGWVAFAPSPGVRPLGRSRWVPPLLPSRSNWDFVSIRFRSLSSKIHRWMCYVLVVKSDGFSITVLGPSTFLCVCERLSIRSQLTHKGEWEVDPNTRLGTFSLIIRHKLTEGRSDAQMRSRSLSGSRCRGSICVPAVRCEYYLGRDNG